MYTFTLNDISDTDIKDMKIISWINLYRKWQSWWRYSIQNYADDRHQTYKNALNIEVIPNLRCIPFSFKSYTITFLSLWDMISVVVLLIHDPESIIPDPVVCAIFFDGKIVSVDYNIEANVQHHAYNWLPHMTRDQIYTTEYFYII